MRALRTSKTWLLLSLFALLGVLSAPVFAFHCCCFSEISRAKSCHTTPATSDAVSQSGAPESATPPCHQHTESAKVQGSPTSTAQQFLTKSRAHKLFTESALGAVNRCQCTSLTVPPVTVSSDKKTTASIAEVALALTPPVAPLNLGDIYLSPPVISPDKAPRTPFFASLPGRSPPSS